MSATDTALTESETLQLTDLEGIIERGMKTFVEVGAAIRLIRDKRLYRTTHSTFEDYCQDRWDWSRQRASQLIVAADVVAELSTIVDTPPANEGQARAIAKVPEERRVKVWETVVENAPVVQGKPKITARQVEEAAGQADPRPKKQPRRTKQQKEHDDFDHAMMVFCNSLQDVVYGVAEIKVPTTLSPDDRLHHFIDLTNT